MNSSGWGTKRRRFASSGRETLAARDSRLDHLGMSADSPDAPDANDTDDRVQIPDFISFLPDRIWYLTGNGQDMWVRRPYGFFFTTSEAAERFAISMGT